MLGPIHGVDQSAAIGDRDVNGACGGENAVAVILTVRMEDRLQAASKSVRLLPTFILGAVVILAPDAAQLWLSYWPLVWPCPAQ